MIACDLDALEERMWHDVNDYQLSLQQHLSDRDGLLNRIDRASQQLLLLKVSSMGCGLCVAEGLWRCVRVGWGKGGLWHRRCSGTLIGGQSASCCCCCLRWHFCQCRDTPGAGMGGCVWR